MKKMVTICAAVSMAAALMMAGMVPAAEAEQDMQAVSDPASDLSGEAPEIVSDEAETDILKDGTYQVEVSLEGGSGKATILSPCRVEVSDGQMTVTLIWSSENYDYMIVDDVHYDPVRFEGGSTFEIPVTDLEEPLPVIGDTTAMSQPHEIAYTLSFDMETLQNMAAEAALEDGVYSAEFNTDSSMFRVNEAREGRGTLTVEDGQMTIHVSLMSKKIINLFPGLAEDAEKEGAQLLEPTIDEVTYSDGWTEDVFGFDIPVPALDEEFDLAIIGEKGKWYDHKVSVSDPQPME